MERLTINVKLPNKMLASIGYLGQLKKMLSGRISFSLQLKGELIAVSPYKPNSCYWGRRFNISLQPFGHNMSKKMIVSDGNIAFAISVVQQKDTFWIPTYWIQWREDLSFVLPDWTRNEDGFWVTEVSTGQTVEIFGDGFEISKVCTPNRWHTYSQIQNEVISKTLENGCFYSTRTICCNDAIIGKIDEIEDMANFQLLLSNWKITMEPEENSKKYKINAEIEKALVKLAIRLELI